MFPSKFSAYWGILLITLLTVVLYWQFFLLGKIPMPGDTIIGAYFPWLDYKWGYEVGVPVKNALISDVFSQFFVWKYLLADIFKSGQIPMWNIYSLSGTPLLATYHSAAFNPFNLLLFLPTFWGWGFYILLQTFFAMFGMFLLLGIYVKNFWARIFGAVVFSLSGLMTTWVEFGTGVWAASMLPWIFFSLEKYFAKDKIRFLFLMLGALVILYLSGHAQLTLYATVLSFIFVILREKRVKKVLWIGVFASMAITFCSFQFLPTIEFTKQSIRSNEAYSASFNFGLNPTYEIVRFFSADFFGNPTTNNYWDRQSYHEQSVFLGTIPFILILGFLIYQIKKKLFNFWVGVFLFSIVLGFESPLSKFLYSLPFPFLTYSSGARIFFLTSFSGGILAATAMEKMTLVEFENIVKKVNLYFLSGVVGIFLGIAGLIYFFRANVAASIEIENFQVTLRNLILPIAVSATSLAVLVLARFKKIRKVLLIVFLLITFLELSRYFYKYNPFVAQDLVFPYTPAIEYLQRQEGLFRIGRLDSEILPPNTWIYYGLQSVEGYDPLIFENYARFFNILNGNSYDNTLSRYRELENFNPKFLDALNVKYLLSIKRDEDNNAKGDQLDPKISGMGYQIVFEDKNSVIAKNPNSLDRAYFVSKLQYLDSKEKLVSIISSDSFNPKNEALISEQLNLPEVTGFGQVEILSYTPNKIEFKTQTKNDEFLVFADTFDKGWKLLRNGVPDKIYETNLALRGIVVPSGENNFVMEYFPDSFKYGVWLSLAAAVSYLLILFYSYKAKKL